MKKNKDEQSKNKINKCKKTPVGLIVACSILGGAVLGLGTLLYFSYQDSSDYAMKLESIYQKSYYDFADNLNNAEIKISKAISTDDAKYAQKLLSEVSKNAVEAEDKLNNLPVSVNGLEESLKFINQVGGYTETLSKKLANGKELNGGERSTLKELHSSLIDMKERVGDMTHDMKSGYAILSNSLSLAGDYNDFTVSLQSIKSNEVDYPTMIYDGPFSDSQISKEVKGLTGELVSMQEARQKLAKIVKIAPEKISFMNETKSIFETYDFKFEKNEGSCYAQITKKGSRLLTMSAYTDKTNVTISKEDAIDLATKFIEATGVYDVECVWSDIVGGNAYLNFAPIENSVILYPDLIKVKVDLSGGSILGYEATSYYTNHTARSLDDFLITASTVSSKLKGDYAIIETRKTLAPIEFSEILCYEIKCYKDAEEYYFYFDAKTGDTVNVLKVVKTSDGNKLM